MSTHYKHGDHVPTAVLAKRLDELSDVIGQPGEERDRELTRRIPAELDRDADLVLSEAAQRMLKMEAERDALSAHVERMMGSLELARDRIALLAGIATGRGAKLHAALNIWPEQMEQVLAETPETSLARLKAQWQAEVLDKVTADMRAKGKALATIEALEAIATKRRQQAEGVRHENHNS